MPRPAEDLTQAYSLRGPRLMLRPTEISDSCLFPLTSQTNNWTHRGPTFSTVQDSCLDLQRSLVPATPCEVPDLLTHLQWSWFQPSFSKVLDSFPDPLGSWLRSTHLKVTDSHPDPQQSLAMDHSLSGCSPVPVPLEFAISGPLWPRMPSQSCLQ